MPPDGPLVGRLPAMPNLFVAVAHPGVILAPAIAQAIAERILERPGAPTTLLPGDWRPDPQKEERSER